MSSNDPLAGAGIAGAQLVLQAVYLKDCSFESPQGPRAQNEWNPQISLDLNTAVEPLSGDLREVTLTVTVSAKQGDRTMFLVALAPSFCELAYSASKFTGGSSSCGKPPWLTICETTARA